MIEKQRGGIERVVFWGVAVLLVFAPLAFGSVHVWAYTVVLAGVFGLWGLFLIDRLLPGRSFVWIRTPVDGILVGLLLVIGVQLVPLPLSWLERISPLTAGDKAVLSDILAAAGTGGFTRTCLAYYRHPVIIEGLKLAGYFAMFYLVLQTATSKRRINTLIIVLIAVGIFEALYAVYQVFSHDPRVWWWKSRAGSGRFASGTFVGSNHFAGYMEILIPLIFGFMLAQQRRGRRMLSGLGGARASVQRMIGWFAPESARPKMIVLFFAGIVMAVALLMSASRGGILSLGFSMLGVSILLFSKARYRKYGAVCLTFCAAALIYGSHLGIDPTLQKFKSTEAGYFQRMATFKSMIPMLQDYPVLGVGWGNFRYLYPRYVPDTYDGVSSSGYSHNDWLEAGTEIGYVGGGLILLGFIVFLYKTLRRWINRRDPYALGIGAGMTAGFLSLAFHSLGELNMHIPANPLTLAAVLGIGYAALHCRTHGIEDSFFYRTACRGWGRSKHAALCAAGLVVIGFALFGTLRHVVAEAECPTEWNSTMNLNWKPLLSEIKTAIDVNPGNAEYHWRAAQYYIGANTRDEALRKEYNEAALGHLETAVRLNPARGAYWFYLGKRCSFRSYDPYGYLKKWLPLAEACFDRAVACAPRDSVILFDTAWYWVWRASILSEKSDPRMPQIAQIKGNSGGAGTRGEGMRKFQALFQRSLQIAPGRWKQAVDRVREYFPGDAVVLGIVPAADEKMKSEVLRYLVKKKGA